MLEAQLGPGAAGPADVHERPGLLQREAAQARSGGRVLPGDPRLSVLTVSEHEREGDGRDQERQHTDIADQQSPGRQRPFSGGRRRCCREFAGHRRPR